LKLTNKTTTYTLLILLWISVTAVITLIDPSLSEYLRATPLVSVFYGNHLVIAALSAGSIFGYDSVLWT